MPRKSIGETAMTDAGRQARYRAARAAGAPVIRTAARPTIAAGPGVGTITSPASWKHRLSSCAWLESLPDNLQDSATAEALRAICELDLSELQAISRHAGSVGTDRLRHCLLDRWVHRNPPRVAASAS